MPRVEMRKTAYTKEQLAIALRIALIERLKAAPEKYLSEVLLATILFETANGQAIYSNNVGNVTTPRESDAYWMTAGNTNHFRAYDSIAEGISGYLYEIFRRPTLVAAARAGDVEEYARQYQATRYCPDCEPVRTAKTLNGLVETIRKAALFSDLSLPMEVSGPKAPSRPSSSSQGSGQSSGLPLISRYRAVANPPMLQPGDKGTIVKVAQLLLGMSQVDGYFGPNTSTKVFEFRRAHRLPFGNTIDQDVWEELTRDA